MALPKPVERSQVHSREISAQGYLRKDGLWDIEATLTDKKMASISNSHRGLIPAGEPMHLMCLRITLDLEFNIRDIAAETEYSPFAPCPFAAKNMQKLIGLQIGKGWMKEARTRIGNIGGCTHLFDMLPILATTAYQSMHRTLEKIAQKETQRKPLAILDSCMALQRNGPVIKAEWPEFYTGND